MEVDTHSSTNSQDPEGSRKLFSPAFPPSTSPEVWFVNSLMDSLSDTPPKLLITWRDDSTKSSALELERPSYTPDSTIFQL